MNQVHLVIYAIRIFLFQKQFQEILQKHISNLLIFSCAVMDKKIRF